MACTMLSHFHDLLRYDQWANERVLASLDSIPADRREGAAYDRLMSLIPHNLLARRFWRSRLRGGALATPANWFPPMTVAQTRELAAEVDREWESFLAELTDADMQRVISFKAFDGTPRSNRVCVYLMHVYNHATYHRGQIARLVTEHGGERAATDYPLAFDA